LELIDSLLFIASTIHLTYAGANLAWSSFLIRQRGAMSTGVRNGMFSITRL